MASKGRLIAYCASAIVGTSEQFWTHHAATHDVQRRTGQVDTQQRLWIECRLDHAPASPNWQQQLPAAESRGGVRTNLQPALRRAIPARDGDRLHCQKVIRCLLQRFYFSWASQIVWLPQFGSLMTCATTLKPFSSSSARYSKPSRLAW